MPSSTIGNKKFLIPIFIVIGFIGLFMGLSLGVSMYFNQKLNLRFSVVFEVKKGMGIRQVAKELNKRKIIRYPVFFIRLSRYYSSGSKLIRYGEYELKPGETYGDFLEKIIRGDNYKYEITFVEGDHQYKYARQLEEKRILSAKDFLKLSRNQKFAKNLFSSEISHHQDPEFIKSFLDHKASSLEGYLFPDTYFFSKSDGVKVIVKTMVKRFFKKIRDLDFSVTSLSPRQVIILASIVEKETGAGFERPLVSSVFHNRLKKNMKLQTDPTILYGIMDQTGKEVNNIRKKDILAPTAYNTYVIRGLPPGPISNPGLESIKSVLHPAKSDYLYFVSKNDGTHIFSRTYEEHLKAVKKYQMNSKMRQGKSWRDLKRKTKKSGSN